jgi:hypothetical protein
VLHTNKIVQRLDTHCSGINRRVQDRRLLVILRLFLPVLFVLAFLSQTAVNTSKVSAANTNTVNTNLQSGGSYLMQKTITWGDGTIESVAIDSDGIFVLNGMKKKLVGFTDPLQFSSGAYWDSKNLALVDTELAYLQSKGVRLVHMQIGFAWRSEADYDRILQLYFDHKMLIVPLFAVRGGGTGWDNLTTLDWTIAPGISVTKALTTWMKHVKTFSNVVAIVLENELDMKGAYTYTVDQAANYMSLLYATARPLTTLPLITKFGYAPGSFATAVQNALIPYSAINCFDIYEASATDFSAAVDAVNVWSGTKSKPSHTWVTETNYVTTGFDATKLTPSMIDALLTHGAAVVLVYQMYGPVDPETCLFDSSGNPTVTCDSLLTNISTWQSPIPELASVTNSNGGI